MLGGHPDIVFLAISTLSAEFVLITSAALLLLMPPVSASGSVLSVVLLLFVKEDKS